jgi:type IV pilus assembly protein PilE
MKAQRGFTLLELMIVVVVIAILAAIAIPNYRDYAVRGKLVEGTSALSDGRVKMEQYFQDNRSYAPASVALTAANGCPTTLPLPASTDNFTYACSNLAATTYTLTATGTNALVGFTYSIDQTNTKRTTTAPTGWATAAMPGTPATCWISKKGGVC